MAEEFSREQVEAFRALPPEKLYRMFVAMFPPEFASQLDIMLLKGIEPKTIFELPSAASIPAVIREATVRALYWRKECLIEAARFN